MAIQTKVVDDGGGKRDTSSAWKKNEAQVAASNANNNTSTQTSGKTINTSAINTAVKGITDGINKVVNAATSSGGGGGGGSSSAPAATPNYDTTVPSVFGDTVDPELLAQYQNAMSALEAMKGQAPVYGNQYDQQIQSLYQQIVGRDPFKYDPETDPLYKQYEQSYIQRGKMASRDVMGQTAGLTGGYGSSYSQSVGHQMYDQYLQNLNDILPQTYGMALDAYKAEGDRLNQNLSTTVGLEQNDYQKYLDALNEYNNKLDRAYQQEDLAYGRMTDKEKQNYNRQLDQYDMRNDAYNRLVNLIALGYKPTKAEFNAAGLSEAQGMALLGAYMPTASSSGGGGGSRAATTTPASTATATQTGTAAGQGIPYNEYTGYMRAITTGSDVNAAVNAIPQSAWNNMTEKQKADLQAAVQKKK